MKLSKISGFSFCTRGVTNKYSLRKQYDIALNIFHTFTYLSFRPKTYLERSLKTTTKSFDNFRSIRTLLSSSFDIMPDLVSSCSNYILKTVVTNIIISK